MSDESYLAPNMGASRLHATEYRMLCRLLRQWREDAMLTQRELAAKLNVPWSWVHKCESGGRRMDPIEFFRWASATGISPQKSALELGKQVNLLG